MLCFVSCLQVELQDYIKRLRDRSGSLQPDRLFDPMVLDSLFFAPRIVQEAILFDARHHGQREIRFSFVCVAALCCSCIRNPSACLESSLARMILVHNARRELNAADIVPCFTHSVGSVCGVARQNTRGECSVLRTWSGNLSRTRSVVRFGSCTSSGSCGISLAGRRLSDEQRRTPSRHSWTPARRRVRRLRSGMIVTLSLRGLLLRLRLFLRVLGRLRR